MRRASLLSAATAVALVLLACKSDSASDEDGALATSDAAAGDASAVVDGGPLADVVAPGDGCPEGQIVCGGSGCVDTTKDPAHCGGCNKACGVGECAGGTCAGRLVFITKATFDGNLGGLAGADAKCQAAATAAGKLGTYKAWLSLPGAGNDAATRLEHAPAPYRLATKAVVANDWDDLVDSELALAINITEDGSAANAASAYAWTFTKPDGTAYGATAPCGGFAATSGTDGHVGTRSATDALWTDAIEQACSLQAALYCFEQQ